MGKKMSRLEQFQPSYAELELLDVSPDGKPHDHLLDPKIAQYVNMLRKYGIETYESCQGEKGMLMTIQPYDLGDNPMRGFGR